MDTDQCLVKINEKRDFHRRRLLRSLYAIIRINTLQWSCDNSQELMTSLLTKFHDFDHSTESLQKISLLKAHDRATSILNLQTLEDMSHRCRAKSHTHLDVSKVRRAFVLQDHLKVQGLCLDCEEREHDGETEGTCKFGHATSA